MPITVTTAKSVKYVFLKNIKLFSVKYTYIISIFTFLVRKHITSEELEKLLDSQENSLFVGNVSVYMYLYIITFLFLRNANECNFFFNRS